MNKAFLSHSSFDKEYVRIVARHLGRANIIFDENNFETGVDFRQSIIKGLLDSKLFVFFASKKSIVSFWCLYEIDKAEIFKIREQLKRCICIIIDRDISHKDLPVWMQESKILIQPRPSLAYRDILHSLMEMIEDEKKNPYIGRDDYKAKIKDIVANLELNNKRIFIFCGLDGIGKRQIFAHCLPELLDLNEGPYYMLSEASTLEDLYLMLIEDTLDLFDEEIYLGELAAFRQLSQFEKINEIAGKLILLCQDGFIPCIIDHGSLLNENGSFRDEVKNILKKVVESEDCYIAIHERRTPFLKDDFDQQTMEYFKVIPLSINDVLVILKILLKRKKIEAAESKIKELAVYIDGYPPAAYFAAKYIEEYGIDVLIADKSMLVDFKSKRFLHFLSNLQISDSEWEILTYLARENFLQIDVLATALGHSLEEIAPLVKNLIDLSLIVYIDEKYGISKPLKDSITRIKGFFSKEVYNKISERLTSKYWSNELSCPHLEIVDATINAVSRSTNSNIESYSSFFRLSTLSKIAQEKYHAQEWNLAIEYAQSGLKIDYDNVELGIIIFKSYAKQEEWDLAEKQLKKISEYRHKHFYYLEGFLYKAQKKYEKAIESFKKALASGDSYYAVIRDYADCLYRVGQYSEAFTKINAILSETNENIYVLDLAIRITIELKDYKKAEELLQRLERCDIEGKFIYTRRANYYSRLHKWTEALENINYALSIGLQFFEIYAEKASILIEMNAFSEAEKLLHLIKDKYYDQRHDVQAGIRCKLLAKEGKWREAQACWDSLKDKSLPVHLSLLCRILEQKSRDLAVPLQERNNVKDEIVQLKLRLQKTIDSEMIDIEE